MSLNKARSLLKLLQGRSRILIQAHNFPDHDAVACGFGLHELLRATGLETTLVYEGEIHSDSLKRMVSSLNIPLLHCRDAELKSTDAIVIVDGCKGNQNVTDLPGVEVAVLDHHDTVSPKDVSFSDIQSHLGACATLIYRYYQQLGVKPSREVATALMIGINMDTAQFTRGVSREDARAYADLHEYGDIELQHSILRNYIQSSDLDFYRMALERVQISERLAFCHFADGCPVSILGILSDFFLALVEVDFVAMSARNGPIVKFSLRSERSEWPAVNIIQQLLLGRGQGGGHKVMAGGVYLQGDSFDPDAFRSDLLRLLALMPPSDGVVSGPAHPAD